MKMFPTHQNILKKKKRGQQRNGKFDTNNKNGDLGGNYNIRRPHPGIEIRIDSIFYKCKNPEIYRMILYSPTWVQKILEPKFSSTTHAWYHP